MDHLKSKGILAVFHYLPLHLSLIGRSMGYTEGQLPVTESMSSRLLRLPFYYDLIPDDLDEVLDSIRGFPKIKELARLREAIVDYFYGTNQFASSESSWRKYFDNFNYALRRMR